MIVAVILVIPGGAAEIGAEIPPNPLEMGEEGVVFGELFEAIFADHAEQADGVVAGVFLELSVDAPKKGDGVEVPAPPQVVAKLFERSQRLRDAWHDYEIGYGVHAHGPPRSSNRRSGGGMARAMA